jgi:hypothetical protein
MKVKELINILKNVDEDKDVVISTMNCCGDFASSDENIVIYIREGHIVIYAEEE